MLIRAATISTMMLIAVPPAAQSAQAKHCAPQLVHKYENDIRYAQDSILEIQGEIVNKLRAIGVSVVLLPEEALPFWFGCLLKLGHANEVNEIRVLYDRQKYDLETYLPQLWAKFYAACPIDYQEYGNSQKEFLHRQQQIKEQNKTIPARSCPVTTQRPAPNVPLVCRQFEIQARQIGGPVGRRQLMCMYEKCIATGQTSFTNECE